MKLKLELFALSEAGVKHQRHLDLDLKDVAMQLVMTFKEIIKEF